MTDSARTVAAAPLKLGLGFTYADVATRDGLVRLDRLFMDRLQAADAALSARLLAARAAPGEIAVKDEGNLLVDLGPHFENFLGELFGIAAELRELAAKTNALDPLWACKRLFVQRRAVKAHNEAAAAAFDGAALAAQLEPLLGGTLTELAFAQKVMHWSANEATHAAELELATKYAAWATLTPAGRAKHAKGVVFKVPHKVDHNHLVPVETIEIDGVRMVFQNTPDTEAPSEMNTYIPDLKALWMAENVTATMHNIYTLRGAPVRDPLNWSKFKIGRAHV